MSLSSDFSERKSARATGAFKNIMSPPRRRSTEHRQNWIHQAHAYRTNPQPHLRLRAHPFSFTLGLRLERLLKVLDVDARPGSPKHVNILRAAKYRLTSGLLR